MTSNLSDKPKGVKVHRGVYIIFYLILAVFLVTSIIEVRNNVIRKKNYKKACPLLEIYPNHGKSSNGILIRYDENDVTSVDKWIESINNFLDAYKTDMDSQNVAPLCDFKHPPGKNQICPIDLNDFDPCIPPFYGYYSFSPCVFLRLSEIHDWIPDYYNSTDRLSASMPADLAQVIKLAVSKHESNQIWISCEGENDVDKESIDAINYYPRRGFPSYFFPTANRNKFLGPLIAVEIVNPKSGYIINIKCRIWSRNLLYRSNRPDQEQGVVRFGIMRDELLYEG